MPTENKGEFHKTKRRAGLQHSLNKPRIDYCRHLSVHSIGVVNALKRAL